MGKIKKAVIAVLGLSSLFALRYFEFEVYGFDSVVLELIVSALTAFGVYQASNDPAAPVSDPMDDIQDAQ